MRRLDWSTLSPAQRTEALARPARRRDASVTDVVRAIFDDVEREGAAGVARWAETFDKRAPRELKLTDAVVGAARARLEPAEVRALLVTR